MSVKLYAFSLNDIVTDTVGDVTNGIGEQFGLPTFDVECETGVDNIDLYAMCDIFNKLDFELGGDFKIGSCTISTADPLSCQRKALLDFCRDSIRDGEDEAENYRASVSNSIVSSSEELLATGGKIVGNFTGCDHIKSMIGSKKTSSGKTLKEVYSESMVKSIKKHGIFNTASKEVQDCLKVSKKPEKCFKMDEWTLPKTMQDAEKDISTTAEQANTNSTSYIEGIVGTENELSKKMSRECKTSLDPSGCTKRVLSKGSKSHTKKRDVAIANIEKASAVKFKILKSASRQKKGIVWRSTEVSSRLPIELRVDYINAAARANAADIVVENLFSTNTSLEKEAMMILDNKLIDASEPFLEHASNMQIKKLMDN